MSELEKAREDVLLFNRLSGERHLAIYALSNTRMFEVGINLGSTGTETVDIMEKRLKSIEEAIAFCKEINARKIVWY